MQNILSFPARFGSALTPVDGVDAYDYGDMLARLVIPGELMLRTAWPQRMSVQACKLLGGGVMTSIAVTMPMEVQHRNTHVAAAGDEILVTIAVRGSGIVTQQGRELHYGPGDIVFRKANMPSTITVLDASQLVVLRLSKERFFGPYVRYSDSFVATRAAAADTLVVQVHGLLMALLARVNALQPTAVFLTEQSLVSLLGAVYCNASGVAATRHSASDRWAALIAFVDANLCDAALSVERVCLEVGISKRTLHNLFEGHDTRYGNYLMQRRLERAREELGNNSLDDLCIAQVAFRCGFIDPSHFSRSFRLRFGTSPKEYRTGARQH